MQHNQPKDYVIATGKQFTVKKFVELACNELGFQIKWKNKGVKEIGYINKILVNKNYHIKENQVIIKVNKKYFRPNEVESLLGNSKLALKDFGWKPKNDLNDLINDMISEELKNIK